MSDSEQTFEPGTVHGRPDGGQVSGPTEQLGVELRQGAGVRRFVGVAPAVLPRALPVRRLSSGTRHPPRASGSTKQPREDSPA